MKAVVILAVALVAGVLAIDASTDSVAEFNTHDADELEVQFEANEESGFEESSTTEAELVDAEAVAEADAVEFEDAMDDSAEGAADAEVEAEAQGKVADMDAAADELDTDEADAAVEAAEAEESQEGLHNVERNFKSLTAADLNLAVDDMAGVRARGCTPDATLKCPDGSVPFTKIQREPDFNGCGPAGASLLNDATLGGQFSPCCNNHDLCYGRKVADKNACDTSFYNCMKDVCAGGLFCKGKAWIYYQAVSVGGCSAWTHSRLRKGCLTGTDAATNPVTNSTTKATIGQTVAASKFFATPTAVGSAAPKPAAKKTAAPKKPAPKTQKKH